MTTELRKELRWWWENRPIKDVESVFICLDEAECGRDHYGQPFKYRLQFMHRLCEKAKLPRSSIGRKRLRFRAFRNEKAV